MEIQQRMPDIILTEGKMQPLDGLDCVRPIRKGEDSPYVCVPIAMLTGTTGLAPAGHEHAPRSSSA